jgi:chaperonin cofactor prefoldin
VKKPQTLRQRRAAVNARIKQLERQLRELKEQRRELDIEIAGGGNDEGPN